MLKEFKKFAMRGNVIDLAVGVIVGGAFNKIVTSLVSDIISPIIGLLTGGIDLKDITIPIIGTAVDIKIGMFMQSVLDFLIISFSVFLMVKGITSLRRRQEKEEKEEKVEPILTKEEQLLEEIRDILKQQNS
ncbi:large-conductance mechanosensitive channel protein MscL [Clostridium swellfunianum]|uniref:large-conductance mechanosensitive channel protein MscL n=1 Tax=Clostridium swellfunianum TaxID=1367462 RepID=UPI00202F3349|nr:large-conductance mechanosensitive channel protein MscL [Clostridium swellfunianum]MCM0647692.1 large-conductance mechanosensitive channel protein MscL [Clostridium swellfunianum]